MSKVRVRYAPSPTGPQHVGGIRTALYNYLFAKKYNGTFILRIEDTDQKRYVANAEKYIINSLNWCNIPFDEGPQKNEKFGPYRQSERKEIYQEHIQTLLNNGKAYYAFDTAEELDEIRKKYEEDGKTFSYDHSIRLNLHNSLSLSPSEVKERLNNNTPFVIRFKNQPAQELELFDEIRGHIKVNTNVMDDKVLIKADGIPTYHFANIVDDHLMEISHVIRGEEWLPSLPLHYLLYDAFNWTKPKFAHLPLILKPSGKGKLSKRDGDKLGFPVFPLAYTNQESGETASGYKEDGYFPEAFINMLAFLGWNPGTEKEIYSLNELITDFDLSRVSKSGAKFSPDKTKWFNQQYMQTKIFSDVQADILNQLKENSITPNTNKDSKIFELVKERLTFTQDFWNIASYFYLAPASYDAKAVKKQWKEETPQYLTKLIDELENIHNWKSEEIQTATKTYITNLEIGFGKVMAPLRISLVGSLSGVDIFIIMEIIGKTEAIQRIKNAIQSI